MLTNDTYTPIIIALDDLDDKSMYTMLNDVLNPNRHRVKVGMEMFTRYGPDILEYVHALGYQTMLDLKYYDIPKTVAAASAAAAELGVWMFTVHALGGPVMMECLMNKLDIYRVSLSRPLVVGITILTSYDRLHLNMVGINGAIEDNVERLAGFSCAYGLDGVVCSPMELGLLREKLARETIIVTPGIRLPDQTIKDDDQKRSMSPREAIGKGASYIVVGSPITKADNPKSVLQRIEIDCENAVCLEAVSKSRI